MDPDVLEMIHAEIDGRLSPTRREELNVLLARDPALRHEHEQLRAITVALASSPLVDVPRDLRASIMRAVSPSGAVGNAAAHRGLARGPWAPFGSALRYGYAFAAGLAVGVLGLALYTGSAGSFLGGPGLAGSMTPAGTRAEAPVLEQLPINAAGVQGAVSLRLSADGFALEINLAASAPTEVFLSHTPDAVEITGWTRQGPGIENMRTTTGGISWTMEGHPKLTLHMVSLTGKVTDIRLDFLGADGAIKGGVFHLPAWQGPSARSSPTFSAQRGT